MWTLFLVLICILVVATVVMVPLQVRYLKAMKEEMERKRLSQQEYFDKIPVQEEMLHATARGIPFIIPANFIAWLWLK
ncbi:DUF3949 domain-containing protein [Sediminibacillus dalangtanensis]|uniref:DUF3949 domain-containing protein n=1 Tax=Sediminibacillus dalangtanensis TaxID=2729421 RepID=A0ABX7VNV8_9BACI|nr:DUF3949 domain-containing protein [Sediminibacillus dalangtanensis]QTM98281.1 DUF3949 domain-containing protein [Sediminibacillus dalangtanensis]